MRFSRQQLLIPVALLAIVLFGLYFLQRGIDSLRVTEELGEASALEAFNPEDFGITVLLAGFRGIFADLLWLRAIDREEKGEYFESQALYETVCRLQPRFATVWAFAGWNLAYNISYEEPSLDRKYEWIKAGLNLILRGFERNPRSYFLAYQIGSLYFHKLTEQPAYRERIVEETGRTPYEIALEWFQKAADYNLFPDHMQVQDKAVPRTLAKLAEEAQQRRDSLLEVERLQQAAAAWKTYRELFPDDGAGESNLSRLSQRLAIAYSEAAEILARRGDTNGRFAYLAAGLSLARELRAPDLESPDFMLVVARSLYELSRAKTETNGGSEVEAYLEEGRTLAQDAADTWEFLYSVIPSRPEYIGLQADALHLLSRIAGLRNESEKQIELLSQAIELNREFLRTVATYGLSGKRKDYESIERQIENVELPTRLQELEKLKGAQRARDEEPH